MKMLEAKRIRDEIVSGTYADQKSRRISKTALAMINTERQDMADQIGGVVFIEDGREFTRHEPSQVLAEDHDIPEQAAAEMARAHEIFINHDLQEAAKAGHKGAIKLLKDAEQ
jgi:hypothetical protein